MQRSLTSRETATLLRAAQDARKHAHAPFSGFRVGAAVISADGTIFTGCNVENSSYGLTVCAERVALFSAIAAGTTAFRAIAVATGSNALTPPCGACRQVISDLAGNIPVYLINAQGRRQKVSLSSLLPRAFGPRHLRK